MTVETVHYGVAFVRDPETDALIDVEIRVNVPQGYDIADGALDKAADDAVESILVEHLYEIDVRDHDATL